MADTSSARVEALKCANNTSKEVYNLLSAGKEGKTPVDILGIDEALKPITGYKGLKEFCDQYKLTPTPALSLSINLDHTDSPVVYNMAARDLCSCGVPLTKETREISTAAMAAYTVLMRYVLGNFPGVVKAAKTTNQMVIRSTGLVRDDEANVTAAGSVAGYPRIEFDRIDLTRSIKGIASYKQNGTDACMTAGAVVAGSSPVAKDFINAVTNGNYQSVLNRVSGRMTQATYSDMEETEVVESVTIVGARYVVSPTVKAKVLGNLTLENAIKYVKDQVK